MKLLRFLFCPIVLSFGGGDDDGGAADARKAEEDRQAKITAGTNRVNELFGGPVSKTRSSTQQVTTRVPASYTSNEHGGQNVTSWKDSVVSKPFTETYTENAPGQFTDDYFSNIGQAFRNYYIPQVDTQYKDAERAIKLNSPSLQSSAFARKSGKLAEDYERSKGDIADRALSAEGDARSGVENSRNSILAAVRAGAGAEDAAASATNSIKALRAPPVYSPLGDLFTRYLNTAANATVANNLGYQQTPLSLNTLFPKPGSALSTVKN